MGIEWYDTEGYYCCYGELLPYRALIRSRKGRYFLDMQCSEEDFYAEEFDTIDQCKTAAAEFIRRDASESIAEMQKDIAELQLVIAALNSTGESQ